MKVEKVNSTVKTVIATLALMLFLTSFLNSVVAQCTPADLRTEYRIDGQWLSEQNAITVNQGASVMLSGLPNDVITVSIITPDGLTRNDNYSFIAAANNMGTYTITSNEGCSVNLTIQLAGSGDTQNPSAPSNLTANSITQNSIALSWTAATDNIGVTGYRLFTNGGSPVDLGNNTSHQINGLLPGTSYTFTVRALDAAGNISPDSGNLSVATTSSGTAANLALNKPATQSSTYGSVTFGRASNAVDGNTDGDRDSGSTTHTDDDEPQKWWRVDLGAVYNISEIQIFNRTDCCGSRLNGAKVYAGSIDSSNPDDYTDLGITLNANSTQPFPGLAVNGRYVMVHLVSGTGSFLSLAEVEVYGSTDGGTGSGGNSPWTVSSNGIDFNAANTATGNVGIGTTAQANYRLAVDGTVHAREIVVDNDNWPDYVFQSGHTLPTLEEVQAHIDARGHLINVPSESEVKANGVHLGEMNKILLEKIEELTLYMLQQNKFQKQLEEELHKLENEQ